MEQPAISPGWLMNPRYVIDFDRVPAKVAVHFGGQVIAESAQCHVLYELGHAPMYYIPFDDLKRAFYQPSERKTYCPYKGVAGYWTLKVGDKVSENAVWYYPAPYQQVAWMKDFAGFYWGRMEQWTEDGVAVSGPREIPGRIDTETQFKKLFPALVKEWPPTKNKGIGPYEFAADSNQPVWWQDASGREWQERIKDRVLKATTLRANGDAHPYG